ncbi:hypothetical protein HDU97_008402 [Phlyctochytrium planicorne]|nr:hypothetical protein HDU97_008402 [Phlyctochytrium planicorne]
MSKQTSDYTTISMGDSVNDPLLPAYPSSESNPPVSIFQTAILSFQVAPSSGTPVSPPTFQAALSSVRPQRIHLPEFLKDDQDLLGWYDAVVSKEPILRKNHRELTRFLLTHLSTKPNICVQIKGTTTKRINPNGGYESANIREETNFDLNINVSNFVLPEWTCGKRGLDSEMQAAEFHNAINDFIRDSHPFKGINVEKNFNWDFDNLKTAIRAAIKEIGYKDNLQVNIRGTKCFIQVKSQNTRFVLASLLLSFVAFLVVVFTNLPIFLVAVVPVACVGVYFGALVSRTKTLRTLYPLSITAEEFYERNINNIVGAVRLKSRATIQAV